MSSSKKTLGGLAVVMALIIIGIGIFYEFARPTTVVAPGQSDAAFVLLAIPRENQSPDAVTNALQQDIVLLDITTGDRKILGTINTSFTTPVFGFEDGIVYYITPEKEIATLSIENGATTTIPIPGATISDFLISGSVMYYLQGPCEEGGSCALGSFYINTKTHSTIISDLHRRVATGIFNVTRLISFDQDTQTLTLRDSSADAGVGSIAHYEIDVRTNALTKIAEADIANQSAFQHLMSLPLLTCGNSAVVREYRRVVLESRSKTAIEPSYYIGCLTE